MYKQKTQKTNSVDVNIFDESEFRNKFKVKRNIEVIHNSRFFKAIKEIVWFFSDFEIFKDKSRFAYDLETIAENAFWCEAVFSRTRSVDWNVL